MSVMNLHLFRFVANHHRFCKHSPINILHFQNVYERVVAKSAMICDNAKERLDDRQYRRKVVWRGIPCSMWGPTTITSPSGWSFFARKSCHLRIGHSAWYSFIYYVFHYLQNERESYIFQTFSLIYLIKVQIFFIFDFFCEFHYLLKCNYFSEKRKTCVDKEYFKNCNILKFGTLMNLTKKSKIKKICTFIRYINENVWKM
jgi:hypothetical protein